MFQVQCDCQSSQIMLICTLLLLWLFLLRQPNKKNNLKVALSFPINKFHKNNILRNYHTYIMINASNKGICVEFWRKNNTALVYLLSNCRQVLKSYKTNPLNIIFNDFSIWLLGYRTKFSCLYLPKGYNFISTVWLWSTHEYVIFWFWAKVPL